MFRCETEFSFVIFRTQRFGPKDLKNVKTFPLDKFTRDQKASLAAGMKSGVAKIKQRIATVGRAENGWRLGSAAGDRAVYDGDWLLRAAG